MSFILQSLFVSVINLEQFSRYVEIYCEQCCFHSTERYNSRSFWVTYSYRYIILFGQSVRTLNFIDTVQMQRLVQLCKSVLHFDFRSCTPKQFMDKISIFNVGYDFISVQNMEDSTKVIFCWCRFQNMTAGNMACHCGEMHKKLAKKNTHGRIHML